MAEQPEIVARLFERREEIADEITRKRLFPARGIMLVARGSSDNAAMYARYLLELTMRVPVALAAPSLYTRYRSGARFDGWTVIAISQSGATPEIITTVGALRANGARAIALTNDVASPLAERADLHIALECGPERAIPATKTFTASLASVAVIARAISPTIWSDHDEAHVTSSMRVLLEDDTSLARVADELVAAEVVSHLGRGFTFPVALEGALKYREMTCRAAEGISASDYLHGPIAAAGVRTRIVAYLDGGPTASDVREAATAARQKGARVFVVTDDYARADGDEAVLIPSQPVEALAIFALVVRSQQIALTCARHLGVDPDHPSGLHKITCTS